MRSCFGAQRSREETLGHLSMPLKEEAKADAGKKSVSPNPGLPLGGRQSQRGALLARGKNHATARTPGRRAKSGPDTNGLKLAGEPRSSSR